MNEVCTAPIALTGTGVAGSPPACSASNDGAACATNGVCVGSVCKTQLTSQGVSFSFTPGTALTTTVGEGTDALTDESAAALVATIDWGDGTVSGGTVSIAAGALTVGGTHTYTTTGIVTGTVTVTDSVTANSTAAPFQAGPSIAVATFQVSGDLAGIAAGSDGNLWFPGSGQISQLTTSGATTSFDDFPVSARADLSQTRDITLGPDGNLWFAAGTNVGRCSTAGVTASFVPAGTIGAIAAGPDGNVWFTEPAANKIGRITPAGAIDEFAVPTVGGGPMGITRGPDGNVWFTEFDGNKIGVVTPAGVVTELVTSAGVEPNDIVSGPDGNLWFTDHQVNTLSRVTTAGVVTPFTLPGSIVPGAGGGLAVGPDGNLWVTSGDVHRLARVSVAGAVSVYFVVNSAYGGITAGPDGNLWATDPLAGVIARITPPAP
jgi:streptogramin lyase